MSPGIYWTHGVILTQSQWLMHSGYGLNTVNICAKFFENPSKGWRVIVQTWNTAMWPLSPWFNLDLEPRHWLLGSANYLNVVNIYVMLLENPSRDCRFQQHKQIHVRQMVGQTDIRIKTMSPPQYGGDMHFQDRHIVTHTLSHRDTMKK